MNSLSLQPSLCTILHHSQQIRTGAATFMIVVSSIYLHKHWFILGATVVPVDCCLAAKSRGFDSQGCECACFVLLRDSGFLPQSRDIRQTGHWAPMSRLQLCPETADHPHDPEWREAVLGTGWTVEFFFSQKILFWLMVTVAVKGTWLGIQIESPV